MLNMMVALVTAGLDRVHERIAGRTAHRPPGAGAAASRCSFRLVHIRCYWRIPTR